MGSDMIANRIFRLSGFTVVVLLVCGLLAATVSADTYDVNASVPYKASTQAATIASPVENAVLQDIQQTITGTCQQQNPATVISIWRNGVVLGSIGCVSGGFSLTVMLQIGQNTLVAKTANVSGIYGPDSTFRTVVVERPVVAQPLAPTASQPTTTAERTAATNQSGIFGLSLTTEAPYDILPSTKQATIRVVVGGGQQPYVLQLKWGDGSTESHSLSEAGTYEFTHTYLVHKTYSVFVNLRDVLGSYTEYIYAVVSGSKASTGASQSKSLSGIQQAKPRRFIWLLLLVAICFLLYTYWLGYRRGRERVAVGPRQKATSTKKNKKKPQKK